MSQTFVVSFPAAPGKNATQNESQQFKYYADHLKSEMPLQFQVPHTLKVGTLDSLMACSDDLFKVDGQIESVVGKLMGFLAEVMESSKKECAELLGPDGQHQSIQEYLSRWKWNDGQYPTSKPLQQLITAIQEKVFKSEDSVRGKIQEFNDIRTRLANLSKKTSGSLAVKPLGPIIKAFYDRVRMNEPVDSEYLCTIFVVLPKAAKKDWFRTYSSFADKVVPDSSETIDEDSENVLVNVVVFKRWAEDFKNACREKRYNVRELEADEQSGDDVNGLRQERDQKKAGVIRILKANFTECYIAWIHLKAIRLFVESILRYGLPPNFNALLFVMDPKKEKGLRQELSRVSSMVLKATDYADEEGGDANSLETKYNYVSLRINSLV